MPNFRDIACPRSIAKESQLQARKKGIFDAARTIGKIEGLNDISPLTSNTRLALEQVAVISDRLRTGDVDEESLNRIPLMNESGTGLTDAMGFGDSVISNIVSIDPGVVNGAVGASRNIIRRARQGNFRPEDISLAVGEFTNLARIAGNLFISPADGTPALDFEKFQCRPSPYARDLIAVAPKQNFQFIVEIQLNPAYKHLNFINQSAVQDGTNRPVDITLEEQRRAATNSNAGVLAEANSTNVSPDQNSLAMAFLVKNSGRPSPTFEYEDLNYYNYRTKGIRKAMFNQISMNFIDDQQNTAAQFYSFYISAISPIVNMGADPVAAMNKNYEQQGMDYAQILSHANAESVPNFFPPYSATIGALRPSNFCEPNDTKRIIDRITIYQFGKNANTLTAFHMFNPRIMTFNPSEVTMADSGEGQMLAMEFDYDYFSIQPELEISEVTRTGMRTDKLLNISGGGVGATFPIRHFDPDAVTPPPISANRPTDAPDIIPTSPVIPPTTAPPEALLPLAGSSDALLPFGSPVTVTAAPIPPAADIIP